MTSARHLFLGPEQNGFRWRLNFVTGHVEAHGTALDALGPIYPHALVDADFVADTFRRGGYLADQDDDGDTYLRTEAGSVLVQRLPDLAQLRFLSLLKVDRSSDDFCEADLVMDINSRSSFVRWQPTEAGDVLAVYELILAAGISTGQILATARAFTADVITAMIVQNLEPTS